MRFFGSVSTVAGSRRVPRKVSRLLRSEPYQLPISEKEIQNITAHAKDDRELACIMTLRHTGLRIGDASLLRVAQLSDNRVYLYTSKTETPVSIVIPEQLDLLLKAIERQGGYFFLRGEIDLDAHNRRSLASQN